MNNSQSDRYKYHKFFFLSQRTFDNEKFFTYSVKTKIIDKKVSFFVLNGKSGRT